MTHQFKLASEHNGWFTKENIYLHSKGGQHLLTEEVTAMWLQHMIRFRESGYPKTVAVIMAGNIPLLVFMISYVSSSLDITL